MKHFRFCLLCLMCSFSQWAHAYTLDITEHIWEVVFLNEEPLQLPYNAMQSITYYKKDLEGKIEYDYFVTQRIDALSNICAHNIEDISYMRYKEEKRKILSGTATVINSKGIDWNLKLPEGATVTTRSHFLEKITDKGTTKIYARRNSTVFWRRDTIDIHIPDEPEPVSIYLEQPGDACFTHLSAGATLSVDIVAERGGQTEPANGSSFSLTTYGTKDCNYTGKIGDKIQTYIVDHEDEGLASTVPYKVFLEITIDVSQIPGKLLSVSFKWNQEYKRWDDTYKFNYYAAFGETENNIKVSDANVRYSTNKLPTSWSYQSSVTGQGSVTNYYVRDNIIKKATFSVEFYQ